MAEVQRRTDVEDRHLDEGGRCRSVLRKFSFNKPIYRKASEVGCAAAVSPPPEGFACIASL
jgi:hypothetical protein